LYYSASPLCLPSPGVIRADPANLPGGVSRLVKRAAYQLRKKNRGQKVFITDQAIQKAPLVAPNGGERAQW
ncbi:MAG: hypothetical protein PUE74_01835, partial [Faecalibacterium sp.]|nr:hypothetical protein [Faecalibacterium sp.]